MGVTKTGKYQFSTWNRFDSGIKQAASHFLLEHYDYPTKIVFNKHTYSQLCYLLSVTPKRELVANIEKDVQEVIFKEIMIFTEPINNSESSDTSKKSEVINELPEDISISDLKIETYNGEGEFPEVIAGGGPPQLWIDWDEKNNIATILTVTFNEELKDMEFDLILVDENDEDDDEDDFDDDIPDLPKGDLVREKELIV